MRRVLSATLIAGLLVVGGVSTLLAHHSFPAEFDINRPIQLTGSVTRVEWINPHVWVHADVKKPDGTIESWAIEMGSPNTLLRRGLKKTDVPVGTGIKVAGYQARDGTAKANGVNVTLPDGRALLVGGLGVSAPQ